MDLRLIYKNETINLLEEYPLLGNTLSDVLAEIFWFFPQARETKAKINGTPSN